MPGAVSEASLTRLAMTYAPVFWGLYLVAIGILFFYRIDRDRHQSNLRRLAERARE